MAERHADAALQVLFGRAFLVELERGDLETAMVFARAFLTRARFGRIPRRRLSVSAID